MQAWMVLETDLPSGGCGAGLGSWAGVFLVTWGFTVVPHPVVVRLSWRCWKAPRFDVSKFFQGVLAGLSLGFFWGCRQGWMELWADLLPGAWMLLRGCCSRLFLPRATKGWVEFGSSFLTGGLLGCSSSRRDFLLGGWMSIGL